MKGGSLLPSPPQALDLCTMKAEDQDFSAEFILTAASPVPVPASDSTSAASTSAPTSCECHAIVLWFDTDFSARHCTEMPVRLSTSPREPATHWAQTVLVLQEPVTLCCMAGSEAGPAGATDSSSMASPPPPLPKATAPCLSGRVSMVRNRFKHRFLDISLEYRAQLSDGRVVQHTTMYTMSVSGGAAAAGGRDSDSD